MNEIEFTKKSFEYFQGSDGDYLFIAISDGTLGRALKGGIVPREGYWNNVQEVIDWHFNRINRNYLEIKFYDLYSKSFEMSLVRYVSKKTTIS